MLQLKFYNALAPSSKASLAHHAILQLSSPHTHVEMQFSSRFQNQSFSSQYKIGPRFKNITYSHPLRWSTIPLSWIDSQGELETFQRASLWQALNTAGLTNYDTKGAISCTFGGIQNPWDVFCSEVCYSIIPDRYKIPELNYKLHPQKLFHLTSLLHQAFTQPNKSENK